MGKEDILYALNNKRNRLAERRNRLRTLEEKYAVLQDFSSRCTSHINSFEASVSRRKTKLTNFESLLSRVKSAAKYKQKMSTMLTGTEYTNTVSSIEQLQNSISSERRKVISDINYVESEISRLEVEVQQLQWDYDNYVEEVQVDGE